MIDTKKPIFENAVRGVWPIGISAGDLLLSPEYADGLDSHGDEDDSEMEAGYEVDAAGTYTG